jgi:hypothetical protein
MLSFIVLRSGRDAVLCDAGRSGYPDQQHGVPVTIRSASESTILLDDEKAPRAILSSTGQNDEVVLLVSGSSKNTKDRQKRAALVQAAVLARDLGIVLRPIIASSVQPELASGALRQVLDFIELERASLGRTASSTMLSDKRL